MEARGVTPENCPSSVNSSIEDGDRFKCCFLPSELDENTLFKLPDEAVKSSKMPPGCSILYYEPNDNDNHVVVGVVDSISLDLSPGSTRENLCLVACTNHSTTLPKKLYILEKSLQYAPSCPVWVKPIDQSQAQAATVVYSFQQSTHSPSNQILYSVKLDATGDVQHGLQAESLSFRSPAMPPKEEAAAPVKSESCAYARVEHNAPGQHSSNNATDIHLHSHPVPSVDASQAFPKQLDSQDVQNAAASSTRAGNVSELGIKRDYDLSTSERRTTGNGNDRYTRDKRDDIAYRPRKRACGEDPAIRHGDDNNESRFKTRDDRYEPRQPAAPPPRFEYQNCFTIPFWAGDLLQIEHELDNARRSLEHKHGCELRMNSIASSTRGRSIEVVVNAPSKFEMKPALRDIRNFIQSLVAITEQARVAFHVEACLLRNDGRGEVHTSPVYAPSPIDHSGKSVWMFVLHLSASEYLTLSTERHRVLHDIQRECRNCFISVKKGLDRQYYAYLEAEYRETVLRALDEFERQCGAVPSSRA